MPGLKPPPHTRLSLIGDLPDGEMFSINLSLTATGSVGFDDPLGLLADTVFRDDFIAQAAAAATQFFGRAETGVHAQAVLKRVKLAPIGDEGLYVGPPAEVAVNEPGGVGRESNVSHHPHQIARKITLETDGDLGRVKGGFYLPMLALDGWDKTTNLYSAETTANLRGSVKTFLDDLQDNPNIIEQNVHMHVVIASAGRHNKDGSLRAAPGLHQVKRVNVGRRPDVIRRRANKLSEARISDAGLDYTEGP